MSFNSESHARIAAESNRLDYPVVVAEHSWPDEVAPLVTVRCITYNHGQFIRKCLEGFLMQETTFPIEILIHDDASLDETQNIIKEFQRKHPTLIHAILQTENQYSKGNFEAVGTELIHLTRGVYVALCEGDDYWTDPHKLQKQVALMEANPSFSMCGTKVRCVKVSPDGNEIPFQLFSDYGLRSVFKLEDFLSGYPIHTSTLLCRADLFKRQPDFKDLLNGDVCLFALLAEKGDAGFIHDYTSTYRIHSGGIFSSKSRIQRLRAFQKTCDCLNHYFGYKYAHLLLRWEHTDARLAWTQSWVEGRLLEAVTLYLKLFPRYFRHVTVVPFLRNCFLTWKEKCTRAWVVVRMRAGLRTRLQKLFRP